MEFGVLGPLRINDGGEPVAIGTARKRRLVLAAMLARAAQPLPVDTLIEVLWGQRAPASARRNLRLYVYELRRVLGADLITTHADGYLIDPGDGLDTVRFRRLATDGGAALHAGDPATAAATLQAALDLWRGPAFVEFLDCRLIADEAQWLDMLRLECGEQWAEARLTIGTAAGLPAALAELCHLHPYRETLRAALMRALYRTGRQAEALAVFQEIRQLLNEQLGTEPGRDLQRLHQAILRGEEDPTPARRGDARLAVTAVVPRELPPDAAFTGREKALGILDGAIPPPDQPAAPVVICGPAGVGKTTLAIHWARRVVDRFPDGQVYLDLHGFAPAPPTTPLAALVRLLGSLGVPAGQRPVELDAATAMYRTLLAGRRMLVVLDNARDAEQVRPLLPATPGSLTLITSRDRLTGLAARDGARRLALDVFTPDEAETLLAQLLPAPPDPPAANALARACGYLPLAIRIAAAHLADRPWLAVADYLAALADESGLDAFEVGGDPGASVRSTFAYSYRALDPPARRLFRLLGLLPGPDVAAPAVTALAGTDPGQALRSLHWLALAHLVRVGESGRYSLHDLLRAYAAERALVDEAAADRTAALDRLLDHYRHAASLAMDAGYPYERERRPRVPPARQPVTGPADPAAALGWLDTELPNLLAAARYAARHDRPAHVTDLSVTLHRHLHSRGHYHDAEALHDQALACARAAGHRTGELEALICLGHVHRRRGRYAQATDHYQQALPIARAMGHTVGELDAITGLGHVHWIRGRQREAADHFGRVLRTAHTIGYHAVELEALTGLGHIHRRQGRYDDATDHFGHALWIARTIGYHAGELDALAGIGDIHRRQGRYESAADNYQRIIQIARAIGDRSGELGALARLGRVHQRRGHHARAADHYERVLRIARAIGHRHGEVDALNGLGWVCRLQGRYAQSADHYQRLLALVRASHDRNFEFEAWHGLGWLRHATGRPDIAVKHQVRALALAEDLDQPVDRARAHDGLAHAHYALHQHEPARGHWQRALDILTDLGVSHADDRQTTSAMIRTSLAILDGGEDPAEPSSQVG